MVTITNHNALHISQLLKSRILAFSPQETSGCQRGGNEDCCEFQVSFSYVTDQLGLEKEPVPKITGIKFNNNNNFMMGWTDSSGLEST